MTETEAIALIKGAEPEGIEPQQWADLGCGSGLFSYALASLLPRDSHILCVDKVNQTPIRSAKNGVKLEFLQADFTEGILPVSDLAGILMANSLHYVKEKRPLIHDLKNQLVDSGRFIIIEYDTEQSNPWVPHPITFSQLRDLFEEAGCSSVRKIEERGSRYGHKNMYACEVRI